MKPYIDRKIQHLAVGLIVVIALSSCAPAATSAPAAPLAASPQEAAPAAGATELSATASPEAVVVTPTQVVEVQAVATSRGPNLEATDPATVKLDSGQLQLVEFFRFT